MSFVLGFALGIAVGCVAMHMAHEYLDSVLDKDDGPTWLGRKCPPCDGKCEQGRKCPAEEKK